MENAGGPLIDAGRTVLMIPAEMVLIVKIIAYSIAAMAASGIIRAAAHFVQAWRAK